MSWTLIAAYGLASAAAALGLVVALVVVAVPLFAVLDVIARDLVAISARVGWVRALGAFCDKHVGVFFAVLYFALLCLGGFALVHDHGFPPGIDADSQLLPPLRAPEPPPTGTGD